ncbi:hypothetical protein HELRODRAFT_161709 [Helobdella robusta]|uniref:SRCR domain-containing protein n=1 Tax=Helobdella robusta TaxID=6412 RepID=T1ERT4_HELRO|nr:hypothetical protein HELRODRAFT_161709 [Helobdella robusta]ESO02438.1 hypothetical protein HELRODRAFT_161709 [Helobdella robusta]
MFKFVSTSSQFFLSIIIAIVAMTSIKTKHNSDHNNYNNNNNNNNHTNNDNKDNIIHDLNSFRSSNYKSGSNGNFIGDNHSFRYRRDDVSQAVVAISIRLINAEEEQGRYYGYLEVTRTLNNGSKKWLSVCGIDWTDINSELVCRDLGFATGTTVRNMMGFTGFVHERVDTKIITCSRQHESFESCYDKMTDDSRCGKSGFIPAYVHCVRGSSAQVMWKKRDVDGVHSIVSYSLYKDSKHVEISAESLQSFLKCVKLQTSYEAF